MTVLKLLKKYKVIAKDSELVCVSQVVDDLYRAYMHQKMLRIPKDKR
jgi:hypothetical protein